MLKPIPYIGITDFRTSEQVLNMLRIFQQHRRPGSRRTLLHVGVTMTHKTLNGHPTPWAKMLPRNEDIADIFDWVSPDLYHCLHFADYDHQVGFSVDLTRAIGYGGLLLNAIQLDMTWPNPDEVAQAVQRPGKQLEVILQIGKKAFEQAGDDPEIVVRRLEQYEGVIHRVLLDKSVGRGLPMDAARLLPFMRAIRKRFPQFGITVAGGLGPDTTHLVVPLLEEFSDVSTDAQGKLRPSGNSMKEFVDQTMSEKYLIRMLQLWN